MKPEGTAMVEIKTIRENLEEIKKEIAEDFVQIPEEVKKAQQILAQRDRLLAQAQEETETITARRKRTTAGARHFYSLFTISLPRSDHH